VKIMKKQKYDNNIIIVITVLAALLLLSYGWGFGHMGGMFIFGPVFMMFVVVLLVWLIVSLTREK